MKLVEQLEDIRREKKELLKMVKKEQDKQRKADKKSKTSGHESLSMTESTGTPQTAAEELAVGVNSNTYRSGFNPGFLSWRGSSWEVE